MKSPADSFLSRRTLLRSTSLVTLAAALPGSVLKAGEDDFLPIIDCHQHLWDLEKQDLPWLEKGTSPLRRNYVMADYLQAIAGTGIRHAIYMEVDVAAAEKIAEGEMLTEICKAGKSPTVAAVIGGIPDDPSFEKYVKHWAGNEYIKGMRIVLGADKQNAQTRCLSEPFVRGIRLLGENGLRFDLCMSPKQLGDGARLVSSCPNTQFIVDHCGNADPNWWNNPTLPTEGEQWKRDMDKLAKLPNTLCKISGIIARVQKEWSAADLAPAINYCLDTFGPRRVVFGSDWPVCLKGASLADWVRALREIISQRPLEEQRLLLSANAIREYALKLDGP